MIIRKISTNQRSVFGHMIYLDQSPLRNMQGSISVALSWAGWGQGSPSSQRNTCSWISPLKNLYNNFFRVFFTIFFSPVDVCHCMDDVRKLKLLQSCHLRNKGDVKKHKSAVSRQTSSSVNNPFSLFSNQNRSASRNLSNCSLQV